MSKPREKPRPVLPPIHPSPAAIRMLKSSHGAEWRARTAETLEIWLDGQAGGDVHVTIAVENLGELIPSERVAVHRAMEKAGAEKATQILRDRKKEVARRIAAEDAEILRDVLAELDKDRGSVPDPTEERALREIRDGISALAEEEAVPAASNATNSWEVAKAGASARNDSENR